MSSSATATIQILIRVKVLQGNCIFNGIALR